MVLYYIVLYKSWLRNVVCFRLRSCGCLSEKTLKVSATQCFTQTPPRHGSSRFIFAKNNATKLGTGSTA